MSVLSKSRTFSSHASSFLKIAQSVSSKFQVYHACSDDPFVNLAIENHLHTKGPADSTILFFFINRPCLVIGRNQNPWKEIDLPNVYAEAREGRPIDLVRRRSGGGTVFHDHGNLNISLIRPAKEFNRNRLGEMVVRALSAGDGPRLRVNKRHDITLFVREGDWRKVSGSAYRLIRNRALHHISCLVDCPNISKIPKLLKARSSSFIQARGTDSVSSKILNIYPGSGLSGVQNVVRKVVAAFAQENGLEHKFDHDFVGLGKESFLQTFSNGVYGYLGSDIAEHPEVKQFIDTLKARIYLRPH